jgi:TonB-dependent receptor
MIRTLLTTLLSIAAFALFAQRGTITGTVTAMEDGTLQPQPFANVLIKGTATGVSTDLDGHFSLLVAPGTYVLVVSMVGHANVEQNVAVVAGQVAKLEITLDDGAPEMRTVQVVRVRRVDSEVAVMQAVRNSEQVANGIGRQQITKGQDRTAADVVKRIPGVTIVGDRFVMVRGLADRYNTVLLNGVTAPSLEPDRRAFSFDLLPSGALDRVMVYKTGAPELPGDFAGGLIQVTTTGVPEKNEVKVSYGLGVRSGTTFGDIQQGQRSTTDFLGFDDGSRQLPENFPAHLNDVKDPQQLASLGRELPNTWTASSSKTAPDQRFGLMIAHRFGKDHAKNHYGNVTSIGLSNTSETYTSTNYNYNSYDPAAQQSDTIYHYLDNENTRTARLGVMHNWSALIGPNTKLEFRNLFDQVGKNETTARAGQNMEQNLDVRNFAYHYQQRTLYSGQLHGSHDLRNDRMQLDWTLGYGRALGKEPDFRRVETVRNMGDFDALYQVVIPPSASTLDAGRFYSDLDESTYTGKLDLSQKFGKADAMVTGTLRAGVMGERKDRDFSARWMSFKKANTGQFDQALGRLPLGEIFAPGNIRPTTGFKLEEGTNPSDSYTAANRLLAGYVGTTVNVAKLLVLSGGVRVENNRQQLNSATYGGDRIVVDNPVTSVLPSVNASWNITEKSLLRAAWSNTVNRPEFRELAPFSFYDFSSNNVLYGNPGLTTATISNIDARWEIYPSLGDVVSVGVFRKSFTNPIEMFFVPGAGSGGTRNFTFRNAEKAESIGAEVEVRRSLNGVFKEGFLGRFGVLFNSTLIKSTVTLGARAVGQDGQRPMMGQSPYVVNAGLFYGDTDRKLQCNVVFNTFGKRLYAVGSFGTPDIYEMPTATLDATVSKAINKHFDVKVGAQNLLNAQTLLKQDSNADGRIGGKDEEIMNFRRGVYLNGGLSYSF